jgi:hypothetical protein
MTQELIWQADGLPAGPLPASARAKERADALASTSVVGHDGATSTTDSDQPMRLEPLPRSAVLDISPAGATMIYEPRPRPLSQALAAMPDLRNRLLAEHVPDASGHRCRACTTPGTGTPGAHWPCRIREAAEAAQVTT